MLVNMSIDKAMQSQKQSHFIKIDTMQCNAIMLSCVFQIAISHKKYKKTEIRKQNKTQNKRTQNTKYRYN